MTAVYRMEFVQTQPGPPPDCEKWDFGLTDFGFEVCEDPGPIKLIAADLAGARAEAAGHWAKWRSGTDDDRPVGYWIKNAAGRIVEAHAGQEP